MGDEDRTQDQGDQYADEQHALLEVEGTANFAMIRTKTKRLSTLRDFSVMKPAKNSWDAWGLPKNHRPRPKCGEDDPYDRQIAGFLDRHVVGLAADEEIGTDEEGETENGRGPQGPGNFHGEHASGGWLRTTSASSLPEVSSTRAAWRPWADAPGPTALTSPQWSVLTGTP